MVDQHELFQFVDVAVTLVPQIVGIEPFRDRCTVEPRIREQSVLTQKLPFSCCIFL